MIPALGIFWFITRFGVNVPFFDQWNLPFLFEKVAHGNLDLENLFSLHNTHRIFFPRIIFILLAFTSGWNLRLEIYFSLIFALITFGLLYRLAQFTIPQRHRNLWFHLTNLVASILFFSWVQRENWLWGFQLAIFLINFCLVLSCLILTTERLNHGKKLLLSALLCVVSSFSSLQGLVTWLALIPSIIALPGTRKIRIKRVIIWVILFLVTGSIYAIKYHSEAEQISSTENSQSWLLIHFFLNMITAPISGNTEWSWIFGIIILLSFLVTILFQIEQVNGTLSVSKFAVPWISLGLFSIFYCILTTLGRFELGAIYAIQASRYTTHSLLLIIASLQLYLLLFYRRTLKSQHSILRISVKFKHTIYGLVLGILLCMICARSLQALNYVSTFHNYLQITGKTCLELIHYLENSTFFDDSENSCFLRLHPQPKLIRAGVYLMERIGFREFSRKASFLEDAKQDYGYISFPQTTEQSITLNHNDQVLINGWAILPNCQKQPNLVFLSSNHQKSFFANADINLESLDVAQFLNSDCYTRSRWSLKFSARYLPVGETVVHGWVYEPDTNQFVRLRGEIYVTIQGELAPELD
ncbi:MAG: hypothetical protein ACRC8A_11595 [Microcoleaceae cyanobacterium]